MVIAPELIERIAEVAKLPPRQTQVLHLLAQDRSPAEISEELGIALKTVHTHLRRARIAIAAFQQEIDATEESDCRDLDSRRRWYSFLLEGVAGPPPDSPRTPKFRVVIPAYGKLPPQGETVRISAGPPLTVDDLMDDSYEVKLPRASHTN